MKKPIRISLWILGIGVATIISNWLYKVLPPAVWFGITMGSVKGEEPAHPLLLVPLIAILILVVLLATQKKKS